MHEIKHDGYRLMVHRSGAHVRLVTRRGAIWTHKYPLVVESALQVKIERFVFDGEVVFCGKDGVTNFDKLHSQAYNEQAIFYAFDLLLMGEEDMRPKPLEERKALLKTIIGKRVRGILFNDHMEGDGAQIFRHACKLGLEGIVSKRRDLPYRAGRSRAWVKVKNPKSPSVTRVIEGRW